MSYFNLIIKICAILLMNLANASDSDEVTPSGPDPLDEWHMDFVPTGYLPDSVYRELAWYGILQVQPLYRSTKHKVAAQWIWQNTLGRPYVIVENQPQSTQSDGAVSHQSIAEESAKWSRERRLAQDVLMENIRTGGNGLTVRTVISAAQKTVYIIQNGKYYSCEEGSEPDVEAFREQSNMHERKCTDDKEAVPLPLLVDSCIDAEAVSLEYSFTNEWMFCLGDGERDVTHTSDGDVDCGKKIKMRLKDFLRDCAIDNNVVITYEYFGDEPRKDLVHNTTLCTSWDPCRISYLYRIEAPESPPDFPTPSPDPCDTTLCPECVEGFSEDYVDPNSILDESQTIQLDEEPNYEWVPTTNDTFDNVKKRAMIGGFLATGERVFVIRIPNQNSGYFVENSDFATTPCRDDSCIKLAKFEVLVAKAELEWVSENNCPEQYAVKAGTTDLGKSYVCRMTIHGNLLPGTHYYSKKMCFVRPLKVSKVIGRNHFEVLCGVH